LPAFIRSLPPAFERDIRRRRERGMRIWRDQKHIAQAALIGVMLVAADFAFYEALRHMIR
jgi:hypothetical protein